MSGQTFNDLPADPDFEDFSAWLARGAGWPCSATLQGLLTTRLAAYMDLKSYRSCRACWQGLKQNPVELDAFLSSLTVGESYFFRNPEQFSALAEIVYPSLRAQQIHSRRLCFWSAGCAAGAEPYSLAIQLAESGYFRDWNLQILGSDINPASLERARQALYSEWDVRSLEDSEKQRWFRLESGMLRLRERFHAGVSFTGHNLTAPFLGKPACPAAEGFHLIICRNVLIYFDVQTANQVVTQLWQRLAPGGWLMLGPVECAMELGREAIGPPWDPSAALFCKSPKASRLDFTPALQIARSTPRAAPALMQATVTPLSQLDPLEHFRKAVAFDLGGQPELADQELGRALFLDYRHVPSHYYRGLLRQRQGEEQQARLSFESALRLLHQLPLKTLFPEWDGMRADGLAGLVALQLEQLQSGGRS